MSFATDKWFKHLHEEILTEGVGDIGLSGDNVAKLEWKCTKEREGSRLG